MILSNELFSSIIFFGKSSIDCDNVSLPCGWLNDPQKVCGCAPAVVTKYQMRISGPLLDRIDIHIEVPRVDRMGETRESIHKHVRPVRNIHQQHFANF
jgi:magnesium chelatase family protein